MVVVLVLVVLIIVVVVVVVLEQVLVVTFLVVVVMVLVGVVIVVVGMLEEEVGYFCPHPGRGSLPEGQGVAHTNEESGSEHIPKDTGLWRGVTYVFWFAG